MVDEMTEKEAREALNAEAMAADYSDVQTASIEGEVAERAMVYWAIAQELWDNIEFGQPVQATDEQLALLTTARMRDGDAMNFLADQGVHLPQPADLSLMLYADGYRDKAILVHQVWGSADQAENEIVFDMALQVAATAGVGGAVSAARYGTMATIKGLPALAAWQSKGAARAAPPALSRLISRLVAKGMDPAKASVLAARGALYGKLPTNTALYLNGVERTLTNPSLRTLAKRFIGFNFMGAVANEVAVDIDNYAHPDEWDEADQLAIQQAIEKQFEALDIDQELVQDLSQLGMTVDMPAPQAPVGATEDGDSEQAFYEVPGLEAITGPIIPAGAAGSGMAGQPGQAPTGFGGEMPGERAAHFGGVGVVTQGDALVRDEFGNVVSIDYSKMDDAEQIQAELAAQAYNPAEDDPLIGVPEGFVAAPGAAQVAYDDALDVARNDPNQGYGRRGPSGTWGQVIGSGAQAAASGYTGNPVPKPATYRGSTAQDTVFNMTPAELERFQNGAIRAGLINPNDANFFMGSRDQQTIDAMITAMGHANNTGRSWQGQLQAMGDEWQKKLAELEDEKEGPIKPLFVPSAPYQSLDPETTRQRVQSDVERQLGRSANDWEMAEFAQYLEANHRANYDAQIAAERTIWEARGRAALGEDPGALPVLEQVDEEARYQAKFEERYEDELEETSRWDRMKQDTNTLFRSFDNISNQLGGV